MPGHRPVTGEEKVFLAGLALKINKRSMGNVAALALESTRPLHNLGSQALIFLTPILGAVFSRTELEKFTALLENPNAIDLFINELNLDESEADKKAAR